jgi:hypothetical protein
MDTNYWRSLSIEEKQMLLFVVVSIIVIIVSIVVSVINGKSSTTHNIPVTTTRMSESTDSGSAGTKLFCRDGEPNYYCDKPLRCGRGTCIPVDKIRCDDKDDGSTYDCRKDQSCGRGKCLDPHKKLCGSNPSKYQRLCNTSEFCCKGALTISSDVSCLTMCPSESEPVDDYHKSSYSYAGDESV